jgi:hypothetical protein
MSQWRYYFQVVIRFLQQGISQLLWELASFGNFVSTVATAQSVSDVVPNVL